MLKKLSKYDIGVAKALYAKKKYPYSLFMGHLALEKMQSVVYQRKISRDQGDF